MSAKSVWLTNRDIDQAMIDYYDNGYLQRQIGQNLKVGQPHISYVINGKKGSFEETMAKRLARLQKQVVHFDAPKCYSQWNRKRSSTKLSWEKAQQIRNLYFFDKRKPTQWDLAKKFGVNQSTISQILLGRIWKKL